MWLHKKTGRPMHRKKTGLRQNSRRDSEDEATLSVVNLSNISMLDSAFDDYAGGEPVNAELIEETDNYNLYSIPAEVNGEETNLRAVYDFTEEAYRVLGTYDGLEEGGDSITSRGIYPLEEGDEVVFLLPTYEADTDEEIWYYTDAVTWSDDVVMEDEDLGDGFFLYMYEIEDMFGTEYDTDPVEMQVDGDTILP